MTRLWGAAVFAECRGYTGRPWPLFWVWASKVPGVHLGSATSVDAGTLPSQVSP